MNQQSSKSLLLVRRAMYRDEWLPNYLQQLMYHNGISHPTMEDLRIAFHTATACADPTDVGLRMSKGVNVTPVGLQQPFPHITLPRWALLKTDAVARVCPVCAAEQPYLRRIWRVKYFDICTRHCCYLVGIDEELLTRLMEAHRKGSGEQERFSWLRSHYSYKPCSSLELDSHRNLWRGIELSEEHESDHREGLGWAILYCDALNHMRPPPREVSFEHGWNPAGAWGQTIKRALWYRQAMSLSLLGSARGLRELIDRASHSTDLKAIDKSIQVAIDARQKGVSVFDDLPLAELQQYLLRTRPQTRLSTGLRVHPSRTSLKGDLCRLEARKALGLSSRQFDEWVREGILQASPWSLVLCKEAPRFDRTQIKCIKRFLIHLTTLDQFCSEHRVAPKVVMALSKDGLLTTVVVERMRKVDRRSAWDLIDALQSRAMPISESTSPTVPLFYPSASTREEVSTHLTLAVRSVLSGALPVFRDLRDSGLAAFYIPDSVADMHIA